VAADPLVGPPHLFCRENDLWLHVDGAHGASALVSERLRGQLDGIALADSVV
jgi:L-2,4-diaminobutyrate decarboxylase